MKRRGLTMMETVLAAVIFTCVALSMMSIFPTYFRALDKAKRRATGVFIGTREMDMQLSQTYAALTNIDKTVPVETVSGDVLTTTIYRVAVRISPRTPDPIKDISVTVSWDETDGTKEARFDGALAGP